MGWFLFYMGREFFLWYYFIPYLVSCGFHSIVFFGEDPTDLGIGCLLVGESLVCFFFWPIRNGVIYSPPCLCFTRNFQDRWVSYTHYSCPPSSLSKKKKNRKKKADSRPLSNLVMFTFLHHSDPTIPHYRKPAWSFLRGAAATVDRPLLGCMGRFFFHNVSHDHVAHRMSFFFFSLSFLNGNNKWTSPPPHLKLCLQISFWERLSVSFFVQAMYKIYPAAIILWSWMKAFPICR